MTCLVHAAGGSAGVRELSARAPSQTHSASSGSVQRQLDGLRQESFPGVAGAAGGRGGAAAAAGQPLRERVATWDLRGPGDAGFTPREQAQALRMSNNRQDMDDIDYMTGARQALHFADRCRIWWSGMM